LSATASPCLEACLPIDESCSHSRLGGDTRLTGNRNVGDGRTERLVIASFALSPLAWSFVYFLPPVAIAVAVSGPVLALILGYQARRRIKLSQGGLRGRALLRAALILGWIEIALCVLAAAFVIFLLTFGVSDVCQGQCLP
jgi:ABC-type sugar transport system permease subunit